MLISSLQPKFEWSEWNLKGTFSNRNYLYLLMDAYLSFLPILANKLKYSISSLYLISTINVGISLY